MAADRDAVRELINHYAEAWADSDRERWLSTFAPDATQEDPIGAPIRRGREEIGAFWDRAMSSYDSIEIRTRAVHVVEDEAALEWTIVAEDGHEWVLFDGVDAFVVDETPLIRSVRAYWHPSSRTRTSQRP